MSISDFPVFNDLDKFKVYWSGVFVGVLILILLMFASPLDWSFMEKRS
jgi:hypothetical protein